MRFLMQSKVAMGAAILATALVIWAVGIGTLALGWGFLIVVLAWMHWFDTTEIVYWHQSFHEAILIAEQWQDMYYAPKEDLTEADDWNPGAMSRAEEILIAAEEEW